MRRVLAAVAIVAASLVVPVVVAPPAQAKNCLASYVKFSSGTVSGGFMTPDGQCRIQTRVDWYQSNYPQSYYGPLSYDSSTAVPPSTGYFVAGYGRESTSTGPLSTWLKKF